ncbi:MAG: hypothetical protein R3214_10095 [Christiangramia sp.]|nr:hypothetical protein [Christiangramia sp.]
MKTYNPHFHLIVTNREIADTFVSEWIRRSIKGYVLRQTQDIRRSGNLKKPLRDH